MCVDLSCRRARQNIRITKHRTFSNNFVVCRNTKQKLMKYRRMRFLQDFSRPIWLTIRNSSLIDRRKHYMKIRELLTAKRYNTTITMIIAIFYLKITLHRLHIDKSVLIVRNFGNKIEQIHSIESQHSNLLTVGNQTGVWNPLLIKIDF